jgi:hypothetical protein
MNNEKLKPKLSHQYQNIYLIIFDTIQYVS